MHALDTLVTSLVHSRLDYCNAVFAGLPARDLQRLQSVLNAAVRLVSNSSSRCHVTPLLRDRHWLPIKQRVQYKLCMLVHRCLHGEAPSYLADLVVPTSIASNRAGLRSAQSLSVAVPRIHSTLGDRAFSVAAPGAWNNLSPHIIKTYHPWTSSQRTSNLFCFHAHSNCCVLSVFCGID